MNLEKSLISVAASALVVLASGCAKAEAKAEAEKAEAAPAAEAAVEAEAAKVAPSAEEAAAGEESAAPKFADDETIVELLGKKMTYADAAKIMKRMLKSQGVPEEQLALILPQMAPSALPQLAEQFAVATALKDAAEKAGFKCEEADIQEVFSNMTERLPPGTTVKEALARMDVTEEEARKEIAEGVPITKLFKDLAKGNEATDEDVAKFYADHGKEFETPEQVRASHILIKVDDATNEVEKAAARAKIEGLLKQIREGADFAELAKAHSDCPSKEQGGDLGLFGRGQMVPAFEKAAFALATNEVSDVVETKFGFHIIKLAERREAEKSPLEDVAPMIKRYLEQEAQGKIVEEYVAKLIEKIKPEVKVSDKIKIFQDEDDGFADEVDVDYKAAKGKACACADCKDPECDKADCTCPEEAAPAAAPAAEAPKAEEAAPAPAPAAEAPKAEAAPAAAPAAEAPKAEAAPAAAPAAEAPKAEAAPAAAPAAEAPKAEEAAPAAAPAAEAPKAEAAPAAAPAAAAE